MTIGHIMVEFARTNNPIISSETDVRGVVIESEVRALINEPRLHRILMQDRNVYYQLCSSLDVIGDTALAMQAYPEVKVGSDHELLRIGADYLLAYGILQVLVVQQDAVGHLRKALDMEFELRDYPRLREIRDIRNRSVGHPTKRTHGQPRPSFHFISRPTLSRGGFQLLSSDEYTLGEFEWVDIGALIHDQQEIVTGLLADVSAELRRREQEHREAFRMAKLVSAFGHNFHYVLEKLNEGTRNSARRQYGTLPIEQVRRMMTDYREALAERSIEIDTYQGIEYLYEVLEYPVTQLEKFWRGEPGDIQTTELAEIVAYFIQDHLEQLKQSAEEIDEEYTVDAELDQTPSS